MARSRAPGSLVGRISLARPSLARLTRPLAAVPSAAERLPSGRSPARARSGPRLGGSTRRQRTGRTPVALLRALSRHRRLRVALLACLVSVPLLAGGWMWLRHSSFVSVQHVRVSGVHGAEARAIEAALTGAAQHMSTLDVNVGALRAAVAPFAVVREVHATASLPHGLNIHVIEQLPVAALIAAGTRTAVAADGVVLGPALLSSTLPTLTGSAAAATGARLRDPALIAAVTVLGAAPQPFAKVVARVFTGPSGLTVAMRNGLLAYFGDATRPHAKWLSVARVLSDSSSTGASYVDVRVPEHPAAGFPAGTRPPAASSESSSSESSGTGSVAAATAAGSEGTIAAIAERLAGPKGTEASEAASAPGSEAHSPSGAIEGGSSSSSGATRAESEETSSSGAAPTTKGP
jgi:cell division septal protein FtsQ